MLNEKEKMKEITLSPIVIVHYIQPLLQVNNINRNTSFILKIHLLTTVTIPTLNSSLTHQLF